jgi:aminomethyltransferase
LSAFLRGHPNAAAIVTNVSEGTGAVAVQGPRVREFIDLCFTGPSSAGLSTAKPTELVKNRIAQFQFNEVPVWVARTGYTGEDGFEVVAPALSIEAIWAKVMDMGHVGCLQPCGLGARDTLRTEVCYPLYGHELDENTTPIEAGLGSFVDLNKGEFVGVSALLEQKSNGTRKKCVAFRMTDRSAPPRPHYSIWSVGDQVVRLGEVASGTQSPSLGVGIGMGYVPPDFARPGTPIEIEIRGKRSPAIVVPKPIFKKPV